MPTPSPLGRALRFSCLLSHLSLEFSATSASKWLLRASLSSLAPEGLFRLQLASFLVRRKEGIAGTSLSNLDYTYWRFQRGIVGCSFVSALFKFRARSDGSGTSNGENPGFCRVPPNFHFALLAHSNLAGLLLFNPFPPSDTGGFRALVWSIELQRPGGEIQLHWRVE